MSESKKNRKTVLLGALIVVILIAVCFVCVTLYAKKEINKPKFYMPAFSETLLTQVLTDKDAAFSYFMQKYAESVSADDVEGSWKTDLRRLDEGWESPFSKSDDAIFLAIRKNAGGQLAALYPKAEHVLLCETQDVPQITKQARDVLDFTLTLGRENDKKEIVDADRYFLTLTFDPKSEDPEAILGSETFRKIEEELSPVVSLSDTQIEVESVTMVCEIEKINEELLSVEIRRDLRVSAAVRASEDAAALLTEPEGRISLPYGTTQRIEFLHYGAHFRERAIVVQPGDLKALPAKVSTNAGAMKKDYSLTFTSSEPDLLTFDEDGVMSVAKASFDGPITVTMTLTYRGRTYTDQMTVYISPWELATETTTEGSTSEEVTDNVGA